MEMEVAMAIKGLRLVSGAVVDSDLRKNAAFDTHCWGTSIHCHTTPNFGSKNLACWSNATFSEHASIKLN